MKLIFKPVAMLLAFLAVIAFNSCELLFGDGNDGCKSKVTTFSVDLLSIEVHDSLFQFKSTKPGLINSRIFAVHLNLDRKDSTVEFVSNANRSNGIFEWVPSAYATPPCPPNHFEFVLEVPIVKAFVTTDKVYNSVHGTDVTDSCFGGRSISNLRDFRELWTHKEELEFQLAKHEFEVRSNILIFNIRDLPDHSDTFRFTVHLEDVEGTIFESTSDPIFILSK